MSVYSILVMTFSFMIWFLLIYANYFILVNDYRYHNIYIYMMFFYGLFLTTSCGCNFDDIDLRSFANCRRRIIIFSICNMWSFTHYFFLKLNIWKRTNFTKKRTSVWILTMFSFDNPSLMSCYFYKNENIDMGSFVSIS